MIKFFKLLFSSTLILGTLISISSLSWFSSWMGLEINLLSFISLMKTKDNKYSSESTIKYFMTQAMGSFILLFSIIMYTNTQMFNLSLSNFTSILMSSAILMKMGAAPLHFWLPEVASGVSWNIALTLFTWQKIAPMIILSYVNMIPNMMMLFIVTSSITGSLMGLNQTCIRKLLAYSSINHISWMLSSLMCSLNTWMVYFSIYSLMNMVIVSFLKMYKIYFINQMKNIKNNQHKIIFMMNLLSLGGLPPFTGFIPKWITINQMSNSCMYFMSLILITFTLITLFFYLRITLSSLTLFNKNSILLKMKNINLTPSIILLSVTPTMILYAMSMM